MKNIYINSQGGLGFNLALSHIVKEFKQIYDKVCILSPYFDVFESNPYVDYVYKPNEIRDFIFDAKHDDAKLICERMYDTEDFIYKKLSYADAWRKSAGLEIKNNQDGSDTKSELDPLNKYPNLKDISEKILEDVKQGGKKNFVIMQFEGGQSPLVEVPVKEDGIISGAVALLHDRTEYTKLMEELSGTKYLVDSMRANNHDFTNKLHVILGLIQIGEYDKAVSYRNHQLLLLLFHSL